MAHTGSKRKRGHPGDTDRVHERPLEHFANQDDSDDDDYSDHAVSPSNRRKSRKTSRKSTKSRPSHTRPNKRRREYSDSEVVSDSEPVDSDEPFSADELAESPEPELNPRTGRPARSVAKKTVKYEESDEDAPPKHELEDEDDEEDDEEAVESGRSLMVKFDIPAAKLRSMAATSGRTRNTRANSQAARATSEMRATRRSARMSHDPEAHLLELTNSGRHAQPAASSSVPPEASKRPTRGGKTALKGPAKAGGKGPAKTAGKQPSLILEESTQDDNSVPTKDDNDGEPESTDVLVESIEMETEAPEIPDSEPDVSTDEKLEGDDEDDDEDGPVRPTRTRSQKLAPTKPSASPQKRKRNSQSDEEFDPEEAASDGGSEPEEIQVAAREDTSESPPRRATRTAARRRSSDNSNSSPDADEVHAELQDLERPRRSNRARMNNDNGIVYDEPQRALRNRTNMPSYNLLPQEVREADEASEGDQTSRAAPRNAARGAYRSLFSTSGPFGGGASAGRPVLFGPDAQAALPLIGDDSSDDEGPSRLPGMGPGLTPHAPHIGQPHKADAVASGPAGLGRMTREGLADISPLGVPSDLGFDSVGGLDDHINKLKEMVLLPLLYPELYAKWKVPPPRGVLFHGPPGTGKTLVARALASSVLLGDKKVTFYMRKGSDVMSKWVGEAERQLRLLFEEAKKNQPSIIFFDEFDGLAPVRSSKQEQTHSSIVATLLALMDGMDNRGQVVVVGATNRPDSIDPAFRRPGRFDREFYFPLPNKEARRAIIDIHTKGWDPVLEPKLKDELAEMTKGYGGADLRALCTEAVINAVQRTYPQIYRSEKKLQVDTSIITVLPKDFIISMRKITASSERSQGAIANPLPKEVEPLLRRTFAEVSKLLDDTIPPKKKDLTALEEAEYDDPDDNAGFEHLEIFRAFEKRRVFRPRLLINGIKGMGQKYLAAAMLQKLDHFFVRSFDLSALLADAINTPESALVSMFQEVRTHQPSVIFIPQVNIWYRTVSPQLLETFSSLLRSLSANDAVLVLGVMETDSEHEKPDPLMMRDIFGFSTKTEYQIVRPTKDARYEFFEPLITCVRKRPSEFPDQENRKKRKLADLPEVQEELKVKAPPTKAELKAQRKADESTLNMFRMNLLPIMREIKTQFRTFKNPVVNDRDIEYLLREQDAEYVTSDLSEEQRQEQQLLRPYEVAVDRHGVRGLRDTANDKFYYNLTTQVIDARVSTGAYKRPKDFLHDIRSLLKDAKTLGIPENILKANNMYGFAMAEMNTFEIMNPQLVAECEAVHARDQERARLAAENAGADPNKVQNIIPSVTETTQTGPIQLGESVHIRPDLPPPTTPQRPIASNGEEQSNGTTIPSHAADLTPMDIHDDSSSGTRPQFPAGSVVTPSGPTTQPLSQRSAIEKMAPGTQATDYHNSASTTTSGQKTSDVSNRSSDRSRFGQHTQSTNGATQPESQPNWPDFDELLPPFEGGSQIPDTQSTSSIPVGGRSARPTLEHTMPNTQHASSQSSGSQAHTFPKPALPAHIIAAQQPQSQNAGLATAPPSSFVDPARAPQVLNDTASNGTHQPHTSNIANVLNPPEPPPEFVLDELALQAIHTDLAERTKGLTVEQIEMVMARCMDVVWRMRHLWDRSGVIEKVHEAVDEVLADVLWQNGLGMEGVEWTGGGSSMR